MPEGVWDGDGAGLPDAVCDRLGVPEAERPGESDTEADLVDVRDTEKACDGEDDSVPEADWLDVADALRVVEMLGLWERLFEEAADPELLCEALGAWLAVHELVAGPLGLCVCVRLPLPLSVGVRLGDAVPVALGVRLGGCDAVSLVL